MPAEREAPETRKRVYEAVRKYPGIHLRNLERQLGMSAPLVQYHLKRLLEEGFVQVNEQGGYARYSPTSKGKSARVTKRDVPILGLLREEAPLHVALLLLDHGPKTHAEIVEATGIGKSTLSYHLAKLAPARIVERVPNSPKLRLADRDRIYRLLLAYNPTPDLIETFHAL